MVGISGSIMCCLDWKFGKLISYIFLIDHQSWFVNLCNDNQIRSYSRFLKCAWMSTKVFCYQVQMKNSNFTNMLLDGDPCTVASNIDGYIPLRFEPFSTIIIQGKQSNPIIPSHHHDSDSDQQDVKFQDSSNKSVC